jgi:hypothetical protein
MSDDTNLQVGVVIDTTGLTAGTQEVSESVQAMAERVKAAFGSVEKAPEGVQNALRVMANSSTQSGAIVSASAKAIEQALRGVEVQSAKTGSGLERAMALATGRIAASEAGVGMLGNSLARVGAASGTLGPLLAAAFPIAAGIALVSVVSEAVDKFEKLQEGIRKAIIEGENLGESSRRTAEGIELENVKLENQIDKLEGRPTNHKLAAALLETQLKADQLGTSLQNDVDKAASLLDTGYIESFFTSLSDSELDIQGQLRPFLDAIQQAKLEVAKAPAGTPEFTAALDREKQAYKDLGADVKEWIRITDPGAVDSIKKLENLYLTSTEALNALGEAQKTNKLEVKVGNLENAKAYSDLLKRLNREVLDDSKEAAREELEEIDRDNKAKAETAREGIEFGKEAAREELEQIQRAAAARKQALAEYTKEKDEELRVALDTAKRKADAEMSDAGGKDSNGGAQLQQKMAVLDAEYNAEREALLKRISELDPEQVAEAQKLSGQLVKIWQEMEDKKAQLDEKARNQVQRNFQSIIGGPLEGLVNGVIGGGERINVAFAKLGQQLVVNFARSFAEMGLKVAEFWALNELETALGIRTVGALQAQASIKTILNNAYTAASAAFADVPFPLNLVVAPAVFATVAALGGGISSAAGGMVVPSDQLAMVHQNEVVLPASISKKFLDAAPGSTSGGGDTHNYNFGGISAIDGPSVQRHFDKHADKIVRSIRKKTPGRSVIRW